MLKSNYRMDLSGYDQPLNLPAHPDPITQALPLVGERVLVTKTDGSRLGGVLDSATRKLPKFEFGSITIARTPVRDYEIHSIVKQESRSLFSS